MIDFKVIYDYFENFRSDKDGLPRLQKLYDYYDDKHEILRKKNRTDNKRDTKTVVSYPRYITTMATSYFLGKNITYSSNEENKEQFQKITDKLATEEEQNINYEIALNCSIFGKAYELVYIDEYGEVQHAALDTRDVFVIKDNTIKKNIICAIRFNLNKLKSDKYEVTLECYDNRQIVTYQYEAFDNWSAKDLSNARQPISVRPHGFHKVPLIEYENNKYCKGDFEGVITLIDSYETAISTSVDDLTDFSDAYLIIRNNGGTDDETLKTAKDDKIFLVSGDGNVEWLTKQINDSYSQNIKNRLNDDIHKFSFTPDMGDEKFSGNSSGVALEYKLLPLEQLVAQKEMYFKKALNERLALFIEFFHANIKPIEIQKIFTRNLPKNLKEISEVMKNVHGLVSQETILSLFPPVEDPTNEINRLNAENDTGPDNYDNFFNEVEQDELLGKETEKESQPGEQNGI